MTCQQCGAVNDSGQRFCYNCGARLAEAQTQATQPTMQAPPQLNVPPPPAPIQPAPYQQMPGGYQQMPGGYAPAVIPNSNMAVISLVSGIVAWVVLPFVAALVAIITGHMARGEIRRSGGQLSGDGLAVIGMVLGYAQMALIVLGGCALFFFFVVAVAAA